MSNYAESKKTLNKIRQEYDCKGDVIFKSATQYVIECGRFTLQDTVWVKQQLDNIDKDHNEASEKGKVLFISREFEKAVLECAVKIAEVEPYDLLVYIQKEMWFGVKKD